MQIMIGKLLIFLLAVIMLVPVFEVAFLSTMYAEKPQRITRPS